MKRFSKWILLTIVVLCLAVGWWLAPRLFDVLPGQIRGRVPEPVLALLTTPLPTALPAPVEPKPIPFNSPSPEPASAQQTPLAVQTKTPTPTTSSGMADGATSSPTTSLANATVPQVSPTFTQQPPTVTASPTPRPPASVWLEEVGVVPQKFNNCGPANLSLVLDFHDHSVDQMVVADAIRPNYDDRNVSPDELVRYVEAQTPLRAQAFVAGDLQLMQRLLAAGLPVIIEKGLEDTQGWIGHYLTLVGYDRTSSEFISMDTFLGPWDGTGRRDAFQELDRLWAHFNRAFVLVYPESESERVATVLGSDFTEATAMWQRARKQAEEALSSDPQDAFAWFNLGASLTHLAERQAQAELMIEAAAAFDQARLIGLPWRTLWYRFEPYRAYLGAGRVDEVVTLAEAILSSGGGRDVEETYLYLGHARREQGNLEAAATAYRRALQLNANLEEAAVGLSTISTD